MWSVNMKATLSAKQQYQCGSNLITTSVRSKSRISHHNAARSTLHSNRKWSQRGIAGQCSRSVASNSSSQSTSLNVTNCDILVLGSGIAGLTYALEAANCGQKVVIVTKGKITEGSTRYAQGGVAAVLDKGQNSQDSVEQHIEDTLDAGAYLNDKKAVRVMCEEGPELVQKLVDMGVAFTRNERDNTLHLGKEGGHSHSRIVHAADMTGAAIEQCLVKAVLQNEQISVFEYTFALDLIKQDHNERIFCFGADAICLNTGQYRRFVSKATILATGGAGQIYSCTTNPKVATGDGMAMAYRINANIANMEFVQFHPTSLFVPHKARGREEKRSVFLISEAVRGMGGILLNANMEPFMSSYDPRAELAPRDIVARGIYDQMQRHQSSFVYLDVSHLAAADLLEHFPNIARHCLSTGVDITRDPIPVTPAQHYTCGGVQTGLYGQTSVAGLYAIGEVASSGVHGANRLASNSLLEGLVFGNRAVASSIAHAQYVEQNAKLPLNAAEHGSASPLSFDAGREGLSRTLSGKVEQLHDIMWNYAGIMRNDRGLEKGLHKLEQLAQSVQDAVVRGPKSQNDVELLNMTMVSQLILQSALQRKESRGLHYNVDHPKLSKNLKQTIVVSK